jgi:hypothetical protein
LAELAFFAPLWQLASMKNDPKGPGILLDRQLHGVSEAGGASFQKADLRLFALERDLLDQVLNRNAARKASGEQTCAFDPLGSGVGVIGGFEFWFNPVTNSLVHEDEQFTIQLRPDTLLADAEELLKDIYEQRGQARIAPTVISIGLIPNNPSALAGCRPATGELAIYSDRNGGLLVTGLAELTKDDAIPISSRQVLMHELAGPLTKQGDESKPRAVVKSRPGPALSGVHIEYLGDRLAYKLEASDQAGR